MPATTATRKEFLNRTNAGWDHQISPRDWFLPSSLTNAKPAISPPRLLGQTNPIRIEIEPRQALSVFLTRVKEASNKTSSKVTDSAQATVNRHAGKGNIKRASAGSLTTPPKRTSQLESRWIPPAGRRWNTQQ